MGRKIIGGAEVQITGLKLNIFRIKLCRIAHTVCEMEKTMSDNLNNTVSTAKLPWKKPAIEAVMPLDDTSSSGAVPIASPTA